MIFAPVALYVLGCTSPSDGGGLPSPADSTAHDTVSSDSEPSTDTGSRETAAPPHDTVEFFEDPLELEGPRPSNLLVITLDTLRRDAVGIYGGGADTPFLDTFLGNALTLDDHRSCANWTYESMICVLTGETSLRHGFAPQVSSHPPPLPDGSISLGERLVAEGFQTALVSANAFMEAEYGWGRAYTHHEILENAPADEVVDAALAVADGFGGGASPFFLHVHLMDPHDPYAPPTAYLEALADLAPDTWGLDTTAGLYELETAWESLSEEERTLALAHLSIRYSGEVRFQDVELARFFETLDGLGLLSDTLVVIFSDHGEQRFDHGEVAHPKSLHTEEISAIAAFSLPGSLRATRWPGPTTHTDLLPTILQLFEISGSPVNAGWPVGAAPSSRVRYSQSVRGPETLQAIVLDEWRLLYGWDGQIQLYSGTSDPEEFEDLVERGDPLLRRIWSHLQPRVAALDSLVDDISPRAPAL